MDHGRIETRRADLETSGIQGGGFARIAMNWANRLTISRLILTVLFVAMLNCAWPYARTAAFIIFLIAGVTDFVDGEIARRYGIITNFGKLMDPLVDKIMMAAAFISLVPMGAIPAWAATTVVAREFLITGLRLMASARGQVLPAERLGKHKTSWQIITVIFFLGLLAAEELHYGNRNSGWWPRAWDQAGPVLVWITVALTLYSGLRYAWRHRDVIAPDQ
jgi:CDP-diacylglycerol--glycerol-3-phosphate 3-phosphatidyltransferase